MATGSVKIVIDESRITELAYVGFINRAAEAAAKVVRDYARANLIMHKAVDTGKLLESITIQDRTRGQFANYRVGPTVDYAEYVEEGRGPVYPVKAKALRFKPKGSSKYVFAKKVGPAKGIHFMRGAVNRLNTGSFG